MGLALGSPNPHTTNVGAETLVIRDGRFSLPIRYSCRHSHFCSLHQVLTAWLHRTQNAPLPRACLILITKSRLDLSKPFVKFNRNSTFLSLIIKMRHAHPKLRLDILASLSFRRIHPRLVSCYAFFEGWLLLSRPPRCFRMNTSFPTQYLLETLAVDLDCCPFAPGA